jgi:multidrug efflux pump subunit AcrA (membrane-fusion protein)
VPLTIDKTRMLGTLLLARDQPWNDGERHLLSELADGYSYAWSGFLRGGRHSLLAWLRGRRTRVKLAIAAALCVVLLLPVRLSALAPAEVVPFKPTIVRAPLDGVVDHFLVEPNAGVTAGQPLLDLDPRAIQNKLDVANKELSVAEAEYRQAAQEAVFDDKSRAKLAVLKDRMDQRSADVAYAQSLLDRIHVTASRTGLAIYDDPNDWIGRPVTVGERLLEIADPNQAELEIWLPVADAITLKPGADVEFFLNVSPGSPLQAKLRQASYEATMSPANLLGYRLKATLDDPGQMPRIGLGGTAKIYGEHVTLFYYLARRPLAAARQFLGW